jgi:hypothetical protein
VLGIQRDLLDKPELVSAVQAEPEQRRGLMIVDAAHVHRVHLDRGQPGGGRGGQAGQHVSQPAPPGQRRERLGREGIQGHVDPVQPGVA